MSCTNIKEIVPPCTIFDIKTGYDFEETSPPSCDGVAIGTLIYVVGATISGVAPGVGTLQLKAQGVLVDFDTPSGGGIAGVLKTFTDSGDGMHYDWSGGTINFPDGFLAGSFQAAGTVTGNAVLDQFYLQVSELEESDLGPGTPPDDPTLLIATAVEPDHIDLDWTDNSSDEDGFSIFRSEDNVTFNLLNSVPANTVEYSDYAVESGIEYYYKVAAYKLAGGLSGYTNVDSAHLGDVADIIITGSGGVLVGGEADVEMTLMITGSGGVLVGSSGSGSTPIVLSTNPSGLYTLIPGQRFDRVYTRNVDPDDTTDVAIPRPYGKSGFIGG